MFSIANYKNKKSLEEWGKLFEKQKERIVEKTEFEGGGFVSTVWLGMRHIGPGQLNIFETMVFGVKGWEDYQVRYDTKEQATEGHFLIADKVHSSIINQRKRSKLEVRND